MLGRALVLAGLGVFALACGDGTVDFEEGQGGNASGGSGAVAGTGGSSSSSSSSGNGGAGSSFPTPMGDPIEANDLEWTWVDFPEAKCRDGSSTGVGVNLNSASNNVVIFLMGGGACWSALTCMSNPSSYGEANFDGMNLGRGIFDRDNPENPVADWNLIFVPYCTGDVHAGSNPNGMVDGQPQMFVGYDNMRAYLDRIVPTFPNAEKVLLTGSSAGGFGAAANSYLVQRSFGEVNVITLDDAGPAMRGEYLAPCLQQQWRETWGLDETIVAACADACPDPNDYLVDFQRFVISQYPDRYGALLSTRSDSVIRTFFGFGQNECMSLLPMSAQKFGEGLDALADEMAMVTDKFGVYYADGFDHTFLGGASFYETEVGGTRLVDFVSNLIEGSTSQVR